MSEYGHLSLRHVGKAYSNDSGKVQALRDINLAIAPGEFVSIVGPSGCGKSTLLRLIIGLDPDFTGQIILNGEPLFGPSLKRGIVFQDHRLLPWLTLRQNVALALENSGWSAVEKTKAVAEHIALVGLRGFEDAYPHQLSGGMAQRAAIARGLVTRPEILLLDEPLGALDALTRVHLQGELRALWEKEGVTMILVTHDVEEAIFLSNRVVVMSPRPGRVSEVIAVDLPGARDRRSLDFVTLRNKVLDAMDAAEPAILEAS